MKPVQRLYNKIKLPLTIILIMALGFFALQGFVVQAVALEQDVRCGIEEHLHGTSCYQDNRLVCSLEEHTHTGNCYLVLLQDNDINDLLTQMDEQEDKSLEGLIGQTVDNALVYNTNLTSPLSTDMTVADVAALNQTVEENNVQPAVVFNENIQTRSTSSDMLGASLPAAQPLALRDEGSDTGSASTFALTDEPNNITKGNAYYFVSVDNELKFVGSLPFVAQGYFTNNYKWRYRAVEPRDNILDLYNSKEALNGAVAESDLRLKWSFNADHTPSFDAGQSDNNAIFGDGYNNNNGTVLNPRYVRLVDQNGQDLKYYSVTLERSDGSSTVTYVKSGGSIRLPSDCSWADSAGKEHQGSANITDIESPLVFTEVVNDPRLQIKYNVNFPDIDDVNVSTKPTLQGLASSTVTDFIEDQASALIRNVSQREVKGNIDNSTNSRMIRFKGWQVVGTDHIIEPGNTLNYADLLGYVQSGRVLNLRGVWEYDPLQTASFYVRYDSRAADSQTGGIGSYDSTLYTNEIFAAFVEGVDPSRGSSWLSRYNIADTSSDNSYGADQAIRNLLGAGLDLNGEQKEIWLTSFPDDQYVFDRLKLEKEGDLTVGGEIVNLDELDANHYTIRWYVFKSQSDAWHIDGRLVKKEGILDITKTFAGNQDAIKEAKEDFYILMERLEGETVVETISLDINSEEFDSERSSENQYVWRVSGLTFGNTWRAREFAGEPTNAVVHSDWRIIDAYGSQSRNGTGNSVGFTSTTIATDMDKWYPFTINFTNIYHHTDSIIIKKEDKLTGSPIGGAVFQLEQNRTPLTFSYNSATNSFKYDVNGKITELSGSESGYYELNIHGFSYANGNIVVKELHPPTGYTPIEDIVIGYPTTKGAMMFATPPPEEEKDVGPPEEENTGQETEEEEKSESSSGSSSESSSQSESSSESKSESSSQSESSSESKSESSSESEESEDEDDSEEPPKKMMMAVTADASGTVDLEGVAILNPSTMASYNNGLLIIKNSTENTSVTVNKKWECSAEDQSDVTVQLMANNAPVTALVSGVELTKLLTAENGYSATWENLPLYANGEKIVWSVKEIKIGNENCLPNYTFINWIVDYGPAQYTYDSEGKLSNTSFTITNVTHRTMLRLIKTNLGGGIRLGGATFTLEYLLDGQPDPDFAVKTDVTDADGIITFHNLKYGDYRLTEIEPPGGYELLEDPIYLTIRNDGSVVVQDNPYAIPGISAYTIQVLNEQSHPLPSTGGSGPGKIVASGLLLMAASTAGALFQKKKKGGHAPNK